MFQNFGDKLELLRDDCKFVYLTHNLDFASSRIHATKLWAKGFTPPSSWHVEKIPPNIVLSEKLVMELLGSRRKILFCEGKKSSIDYKLYTLLFPEYTIKPVGGHLMVINFTRAFNKLENFFRNNAIGIIDGDFHLKDEKEKWKEDSIYCIKAQEVENILCDEELLVAGESHFCSNSNVAEKAKIELFNMIEQTMDEQVLQYVWQTINNKLKSNLIDKPQSIDELKDQLKFLVQNNDVDTLRSKRSQLWKKIIKEKDFDLAIRTYNNKGLAGRLGGKIVGDYKSRMLIHLGKNPDLVKKLKQKYFSNIPDA